MIRLVGIPAAPGFAVGRAHWYGHGAPGADLGPPQSAELERARLQEATKRTRQDLIRLVAQARELLGEGAASLFEAHLLMLEDPSLHEAILDQVEVGKRLDAAVAQAVDRYASQLERLENPTFGARALDIREVGDRLIQALAGAPRDRRPEIPRSSILLARDLRLSDLVRVDRERVLGWCTEEGNAQSHAAILAAGLGFPAVMGLGPALRQAIPGDSIALDGEAGAVFIRPNQETRKRLGEQRSRYLAREAQVRAEGQGPAVTQDGHRVRVLANLSDAASAGIAISHGAEGVGLLRTEFLFLDRLLLPDEEEQLSAYTAVLDAIGPRPVTIRTADLGGDKWPAFLPRPHAGTTSSQRGIGFSLRHPGFFKSQLRALLKATATHDLRILLPMVTTLEEVRDARRLIQECHGELQPQGPPAEETVQIGAMVEVPAAVKIAQELAAQVDFLTLGTNDLVPQLFGSDRTTGERHDPLDPIVLGVLQKVVEAGHSAGIGVSLCGELAAEVEAIPILVGLDLDELSMRPTAIPSAKARIRSLSKSRAQALTRQALQLPTASEVRGLVASFLNQS